jgi:PAS domain S-box-containing protein
MITFSFIKTTVYLSLLSTVPVTIFFVLIFWSHDGNLCPATWYTAGGCFFIALAAALVASIYWHKRLARQAENLIDYCNSLALGNSEAILNPPTNLPDLGNLGLAIQVMREVLVDYLSLYRRFFEAAPDMFLSLTPAGGRILDANQALFRALGMLKTEVLGQPLDKFVKLNTPLEEILTSPQSERIKACLDSTVGPRQVEMSISWEPTPQGRPWVLGVMLRDVTERDLLHNRLLQKSAALENALEEIKGMEALKDQFLTTLTHELKTPLVALKGFMELLKSGRVPEENKDEYFTICWRNLEKLEKQINNLLDLARLSHGRDQVEMGKVDLAALLSNEIENLKPMAAENKINLKVQGPKNLFVHGNAEKLMQLVDNLLLNAIKYNKQGGEVQALLKQMNQKAVLTISDTGVGIKREDIAHIFNRFYRSQDISGSGRLEGLGIGLSLVQEIVRLHKGNVHVDSTKGHGTTFTVEIGADS